jgi:hypothetical protein
LSSLRSYHDIFLENGISSLNKLLLFSTTYLHEIAVVIYVPPNVTLLDHRTLRYQLPGLIKPALVKDHLTLGSSAFQLLVDYSEEL